jgi:hypothetical protein
MSRWAPAVVDVLEHGDVERAAVGRLVLAQLKLVVDLVAVGLDDPPGIGVGRLPVVGPVFKVVLKHQRQVALFGRPGRRPRNQGRRQQ